jgi:hypothetical protein
VTQAATPVFPPGRYGHRREPGRRRPWTVLLLLVPVVVLGLWISFTLYEKYGNPTFHPSAATAVDVTDTSVTVRFTVHKGRAETGACRVRGRDRSGSQVGYAKVPVGPGTDLTINYPLPTTGRAFAVDVLGCTPS